MLPTTRAALASEPRTAATYDLPATAFQLRRRLPWRAHGHGAVTLVRTPELRVVLLELRAGARLLEHRTAARLLIQPLRGSIRLRLGERHVDLASREVLTLAPGIVHDVEATDDSSVLLTLAWPPDDAAKASPAAGPP